MNHIDTLHKEVANLTDISRELDRLSESFFDVGNEYMGDKLYRVSKAIFSSTHKINESYSKELDVQFQNAQATSGAMLSLALNLGEHTPLTEDEQATEASIRG